MTTKSELIELAERVSALLAIATGHGDRALPWKVWTSNSFRRVRTDGRETRDVLSAIQCSDGCLDLSMPEERLIALVYLLNELPALLSTLRAIAEGSDHG